MVVSSKLVTKMKPYTNSIEIHPQLSNNKHLVNGTLMGVGSLWSCPCAFVLYQQRCWHQGNFFKVHSHLRILVVLNHNYGNFVHILWRLLVLIT